jgi:hypothetical protein
MTGIDEWRGPSTMSTVLDGAGVFACRPSMVEFILRCVDDRAEICIGHFIVEFSASPIP